MKAVNMVFFTLFGLISFQGAAEGVSLEQQIEETNEAIKQEEASRDQMKEELSEKDKEVADLREKLKQLEEQTKN